jgi:hypothetical protein
MSPSHLMTSVKRTCLNVYGADIFNCSQQLPALDVDTKLAICDYAALVRIL